MEIEDIKSGEYVRTNSGRIYKLGYYNEEEKRWIVVTDEDWFPVYTSEIIKNSEEIIDLVEKGDYVNGYRVVEIMEDMKTGEIHLEMTSDYTNQEKGDCTIYNKDIKSIITKEQIKEIEYKVGE